MRYRTAPRPDLLSYNKLASVLSLYFSILFIYIPIVYIDNQIITFQCPLKFFNRLFLRVGCHMRIQLRGDSDIKMSKLISDRSHVNILLRQSGGE